MQIMNIHLFGFYIFSYIYFTYIYIYMYFHIVSYFLKLLYIIYLVTHDRRATSTEKGKKINEVCTTDEKHHQKKVKYHSFPSFLSPQIPSDGNIYFLFHVEKRLMSILPILVSL